MAGCSIPPLDAGSFLSVVHGKHIAFIGDSMVRNQAQSLICLLTSSAFPHRLVYHGADNYLDKYNYWRYTFPSHNVTVSFYWAPFLVKAKGKPKDDGLLYSYVHLNEPEDRWAADVDTIDVAVLGVGHWLLNGAIYYNGSDQAIGAHNAPPEFSNLTMVGYAWPLRTVYRTVMEWLLVSSGRRWRRQQWARTMVLTMFSPPYFEARPAKNPTEWVCMRTKPYEDGENAKDLETPALKEVKEIVYDEAEAARARYGDGDGGEVRIEVLDVTKLAAMRPDGHPGVYHDLSAAQGIAQGKKLILGK
uniref:Trichome birefringence-like C-terminal domain-containing protein n=1 Tax=Leersia perrieri TaxID=77586 RepID=A0A0D9WXD3_9ORYZ